MTPTKADEISSAGCNLRNVIAREYDALCRCVMPLIRQPMRYDQRRERAEEVVAEAVERALIRGDRFEASRPVFPWIMAFAANIAKERSRTDRRGPAIEADVEDATWRAALETQVDRTQAVDRETSDRLQRAMACLPEAERKLINLAFFEDLDGANLAAAVGAPNPGAARVRRCRALRALRAAFILPGEELTS